LASKIETRGP